MAMAVGARPIKAPGWSGGARTDIALVDCDVHQTVEKPEDLSPICPASTGSRRSSRASACPVPATSMSPTTPRAPTWQTNCDCHSHDGRQMGTTYERLREQHLDLWNVDKVLLTGASTYGAVDPARSRTSPPRSAAPSTTGRSSTGWRRTTGC